MERDTAIGINCLYLLAVCAVERVAFEFACVVLSPSWTIETIETANGTPYTSTRTTTLVLRDEILFLCTWATAPITEGAEVYISRVMHEFDRTWGETLHRYVLYVCTL